MIEKVSENKKYVKFLTYGCQMNFSDAERMEGELARIGQMNNWKKGMPGRE